MSEHEHCNDRYKKEIDKNAKLQAELTQLKSESGFGTLLAENRATIQRQAEQIRVKDEQIEELQSTVALFNSMILSGERHSSVSLARLESAMQTKIKVCKAAQPQKGE